MKYEREMDDLRLAAEGVLHELVVGARSTAATRAALLPHSDQLAAFLGRRYVELLPQLLRIGIKVGSRA